MGLLQDFKIPDVTLEPNAEASDARRKAIRAQEIFMSAINMGGMTVTDLADALSVFDTNGQKNVEGMIRQYHIGKEKGSEEDLAKRAKAIIDYVNVPTSI